MNFTTRDYNDGLDGDFLACKPGNVAEGLEFVCTLGIPILGWAHMPIALGLFYLVFIQRRHRKLIAKQIRDAAYVPNAQDAPRVYPQSDVTNMFSYMEKLLLSMGVAILGTSLSWLVNSYGLMYPTSHFKGQMGDIAVGISYAAFWYTSLLQYRGAIHFRSSIPQPQGTIHLNNNKPKSRFHLPSPSTLLDIMQSWLAPLIALVLWGLLRAGIYSRGWFLFCLVGMQAVYGLRSFVSIVFQRLATLKHLAVIVNAKSGTREEKNRRHGFLTRKTISLMIDLIVVFCSSVLVPAFYVLLGCTFNSRRFAYIGPTMSVLCVITWTLTCIHIHSKFNKLRRKKKKTSAFKGPSAMLSKGKSLPSGLSVVEQSDV